MLKLARENPKLVVVTPAMPEGNCLSAVQEEFPNGFLMSVSANSTR